MCTTRPTANGSSSPGVPAGGEGPWSISVMKADGTDRTQITRGTSGSSQLVDEFPAWVSDGRIVFFRNRAGGPGQGMWTINADGSGARLVTPGVGAVRCGGLAGLSPGGVDRRPWDRKRSGGSVRRRCGRVAPPAADLRPDGRMVPGVVGRWEADRVRRQADDSGDRCRRDRPPHRVPLRGVVRRHGLADLVTGRNADRLRRDVQAHGARGGPRGGVASDGPVRDGRQRVRRSSGGSRAVRRLLPDVATAPA